MPVPSPNSSSAPSQKGGEYVFTLNRDVKALNAAVMVMMQKIKLLVRNEKILGRNLIVLNKRVRDIQMQAGANGNQEMSDSVRETIDELATGMRAVSQRLVELESKLDELSRQSAKAEDVKEIKYVVDTMNPLHFVTIEQANEMIGKNRK
ncbi:MAG: hypothetical protein V1776_03965 [Candidatus Diapherotrites archaeon]